MRHPPLAKIHKVPRPSPQTKGCVNPSPLRVTTPGTCAKLAQHPCGCSVTCSPSQSPPTVPAPTAPPGGVTPHWQGNLNTTPHTEPTRPHALPRPSPQHGARVCAVGPTRRDRHCRATDNASAPREDFKLETTHPGLARRAHHDARPAGVWPALQLEVQVTIGTLVGHEGGGAGVRLRFEGA